MPQSPYNATTVQQASPIPLFDPGHSQGIMVIGCWLLVVAVLLTYSTHVALTAPDKRRRDDAYRVLKLITVWTAGGGGVLGVLLHLTGLAL